MDFINNLAMDIINNFDLDIINNTLMDGGAYYPLDDFMSWLRGILGH